MESVISRAVNAMYNLYMMANNVALFHGLLHGFDTSIELYLMGKVWSASDKSEMEGGMIHIATRFLTCAASVTSQVTTPQTPPSASIRFFVCSAASICKSQPKTFAPL